MTNIMKKERKKMKIELDSQQIWSKIIGKMLFEETPLWRQSVCLFDWRHLVVKNAPENMYLRIGIWEYLHLWRFNLIETVLAILNFMTNWLCDSPCSNFQFLTTFNTPIEVMLVIYLKNCVKIINGLYIAISKRIFFEKNLGIWTHDLQVSKKKNWAVRGFELGTLGFEGQN